MCSSDKGLHQVSRSIVIFEDHSLVNFRPLAWSVPTYELRLGMFNTREKLELANREGQGTQKHGVLLCRKILAPLHTCQGWEINPEVYPSAAEATDRVLWLNGRCQLSFASAWNLLNEAKTTGNSFVADEYGLLAADLSPESSRNLWRSWNQWNAKSLGNEKHLDPWQEHQSILQGSRDFGAMKALGHIWDIVPSTAEALRQDVDFLSSGLPFSRHPFGILPDPNLPPPNWLHESRLIEASTHPELGKRLPNGGQGLWLGENVTLGVGVAFDATNGPIILDRGVNVMPNCYLEGPLYVGPDSRIKAGATIYGESSFGIGNRLSGEIGESTFSDFANKQHDGFIGHAVLGSWTNLGAMTTCSDLKNNYGNVRVDLGTGAVDTGLRFVGLLMGDHVKTAIGTLFNTGTAVGFASNVFGGAMPPKHIPNYSWGGMPDSPYYDVNKAIETAGIVMGRRGCHLGEGTKNLMQLLA
jgi:UDP-N-acetylglucosamine diphosphorylase/glucosamine-1-phosphate N-acetyltransferase